MAARIASIGLGAICLLIALFSTGVLQPIDCEVNIKDPEGRLRGASTVDKMKKVLKSLKNQDNVEVFGVSVSELLRLMDNTKMDCSRPEEIELAIKALTDEEIESFGVQKFRKYLFSRIFAECIDKLTRLRDPKLRQFMDATDKKVLLRRPKYPSELKDLEMRQTESCKKASALLKIHDIIPAEGAAIYGNSWIRLWKDVWSTCQLRLANIVPPKVRPMDPNDMIRWYLSVENDNHI